MEQQFDKILREQIQRLDRGQIHSQEMKEEIWSAINSKQKVASRPVFFRIAAAVVILAGVAFFLIDKSQNDSIVYSYSSEKIQEPQPPDWISDSEAVDFVREQCQRNLPVCESPEFKLLLDELDNAEKEIESLSTVIDHYGEDPDLIKSKIEIENFKAEITQKMIIILLS